MEALLYKAVCQCIASCAVPPTNRLPVHPISLCAFMCSLIPHHTRCRVALCMQGTTVGQIISPGLQHLILLHSCVDSSMSAAVLSKRKWPEPSRWDVGSTEG